MYGIAGVQIEACLALQLAAQLASLGHFTEFRTSQPWAILKDFNTHIYPSSSLDNVDVSSLIAVCNAAKYLSCVAAAKNVAGCNKSHAYPCLASHIAKCLIYQVVYTHLILLIAYFCLDLIIIYSYYI